MSSHECWAELNPDPRLRRRVLISGVIAMFTGIALIFQLPVPAVWRAISAVVWISTCCYELHLRWAIAPRVARIDIAASGEIRISDNAGRIETVQLLPGTIVIASLAWLRLGFADGKKYAELLSGNAVDDAQWHRFQLIWRQTRLMIGRADRS